MLDQVLDVEKARQQDALAARYGAVSAFWCCKLLVMVAGALLPQVGCQESQEEGKSEEGGSRR